MRKRSSGPPKLEPEPVLVHSATCAPSPAAAMSSSTPIPAPSPAPGQRTPSGVQTPQEMLYNSASTVGLHRGSSQQSSQSLGAGEPQP